MTAFLVALGACGSAVEVDPGQSGETGGSTTSDVSMTASPSTSGPGTSGGVTSASSGSTAAPTSAADGSSSESSTTSVVVPEDCDVFAQDCPSGYKCAPISNDGGPAWNDTSCVPVVDDPVGLGETCAVEQVDVPDGLDDCGVGQMCFDIDPRTLQGECIGLCLGAIDDLTCEDPNGVCLLSAQGAFNPCFSGCDPLADDCEPQEVCAPGAGSFVCVDDASGKAGAIGDPCEFPNACDSGLVCIQPTALACDDVDAGGCCLPLCSLAADECLAGLSCLPWWPEGEAPEGLEDVGVCTESE